MSARLIKSADQAAVSFAPFALQTEAGGHKSNGIATSFTPLAAGDFAHSRQNAQTSLDAVQAATSIEIDSHSSANLKAARAEAEQIIAKARAEASEIEREARERGLSAARASVQTEAAQLAEPLRQQLAQTIEEVAALRASIAERTERDLVKLAIEIAKKIVHREVTTDNEIALTLARVALARLHTRAEATVHLHPDDFAYVSKHSDRLTNGSAVELVEDRAVGRGGCLIVTEMGDTDARIEQQFAEIERSFLGA